MAYKKKISFPDMLEVVLMHGTLSIATDTQIAEIFDVILHTNMPAYCWTNFEEMTVGNGDSIIQFNKIKPFVEYVYDKIISDQANS